MSITTKGIENSWILYGLLLLSCMNFMGRGPIFFFLFSIYGILRAGKKLWDDKLVPYIFLSISAAFVSMILYDIKEFVKASVFFLSCYVGFIGYLSSIDKDKFIKRIFLSASLGSFIYLILTYRLNFNIVGLQEGSRILINYWTMEPLPATCLGLISSTIIIYSFYLIFCEKRKLLKFVGLLFLLFTLFANISTASRTPIALFIVVYTLMLCLLFRGLRIRGRIGLILFLCLIAVMFSSKVIDFFQESSLAERFEEEGMKTTRWDLTIDYFEGMLNHIWGGRHIYEDVGILAHNFIQESYDLYGVLFFIPLMFVCCGIFKRNYILYNCSKNSHIYLILLGLSVGLFIQNILEPTIAGFPQILFLLFMTDGIIIALLKSQNNINKKKIYE